MPKLFGIWRRKMLEIPVNQAHLMYQPICADAPFIVRNLFVNSSPSTDRPLSRPAATSDLFDQSALSTLAQRLVEAARRAGADAADAVAVRGVSQGVEVRDGRVEESERSEGDDVGLRVLVGRRQAVVSTNDVSGDGVAQLAERAVAMARVAPDDKFVGLADPQLLAREFADLDLLDRKVPTTAELERRACEAEAAALAVKGVSKSGGASASSGIGGMVLVTSTGFHGSYLRSSQGISMTAIVRRRHRHGARLRLLRRRRTPPTSRRPKASAARPASVRWRAPIRARSRPARCPWCSTRGCPDRWSAISSARSTAPRSRARPAS